MSIVLQREKVLLSLTLGIERLVICEIDRRACDKKWKPRRRKHKFIKLERCSKPGSRSRVLSKSFEYRIPLESRPEPCLFHVSVTEQHSQTVLHVVAMQ